MRWIGWFNLGRVDYENASIDWSQEITDRLPFEMEIDISLGIPDSLNHLMVLLEKVLHQQVGSIFRWSLSTWSGGSGYWVNLEESINDLALPIMYQW